MRISFVSSAGNLYEECLRFGAETQNESFVDWLLSNDLSFWQVGDCENHFKIYDSSNEIQQQLDIYRHEDLGYVMRFSWENDYPSRMFYALNSAQTASGVGVVHLDGNGLIYPAELFNPKESVKSVLMDLVHVPQMKDRNPGSVTWISSKCISGDTRKEPPHQYYMQFELKRDKMS